MRHSPPSIRSIAVALTAVMTLLSGKKAQADDKEARIDGPHHDLDITSNSILTFRTRLRA